MNRIWEDFISGSPGMRRGCVRFRYFKPVIGTPAGATITPASLFGANDATRPEFMVLSVKGLSRDFSRRSCEGETRYV